MGFKLKDIHHNVLRIADELIEIILLFIILFTNFPIGIVKMYNLQCSSLP